MVAVLAGRPSPVVAEDSRHHRELTADLCAVQVVEEDL